MAFLAARSKSVLALESVIAKAKDYAHNSKAESTRRSYESVYADFQAFCQQLRFEALSALPQTVALYVSELARYHS